VSNFWHTVLPPVLTALVPPGGLTRITRLQRLINTSIDLLGRLPADHPNRATLEDHNGELI
jgi:hypothetical protein